ncbi:TolC family protein [Acidihalobacter prosperus]|nr:TolC family protein [Acidihalobacter prosperus]
MVICLGLILPWSIAWAADPLGAYDGLGHGAGRLLSVPEALPPPTPTMASLPPGWENQALSLAQISWLALRNNPRTHAAWAQLQAQAALLGQARSAWWPTLSLSVPLQRRRTTSAAGFALPQQDTASPNFSLTFLIWDFGHRSALIDQARADVRAAEFAQNATVQSVLYGVQQAYYALLGQRALLDAYRAALEQSRQALTAAEALHRAGRATVSDLYQARAALAQAQANLSMAEQSLNSDAGTLASAAGLPLNMHLHLAALNVDAPPAMMQSVASLMQAALAANPGLRSAQYQVTAAHAGLSAAERSDLPTVSLGADQGWHAQNGFGPSQQYSIGITLTVPLFTGFQHTYQVAQARAQLAQARASLDDTINATRLSVWQSYYAFRSASLALPSAKAQEANAAKALEAVQAQYRVGLATMQDLLSAQSALSSARVAVIRDAINSYLALAGLSSAVGTLSPPDGGMGRQP